jgi:hypothetical protein
MLNSAHITDGMKKQLQMNSAIYKEQKKMSCNNHELVYDGAMRKKNCSNEFAKSDDLRKSELLDNAATATMAETTTTKQKNNVMENNTEAKAKRTKTNYDIVMGAILAHIKNNPGATIPQIHEAFGVTDANPTGHKVPVVYQAIRNLKSRNVVFGTGAKKNEGLYLTAEDAEANKPVATERPQRKKDKAFTLEKLMPKGTWWTVEGNDDKDAILKAYELATTVPGNTFRVMDNTGDAPVVVSSNEVPASDEVPATTSKPKSKKVKAETVEA